MRFLLILLIIYICICTILFFFQEHLLFFPQKTDRNAVFPFRQRFDDLHFTTKDGVELNGVLFKSDSAKGVIIYLHGNGGSIESWGVVAETYTRHHYDCFMLDYRGYGKSKGRITSEQQLHDDVQFVFDQVSQQYRNLTTIVLGYSLGTALAAKLASQNNVDMLILQAPYYSMTDVMKDHYPVIPTFILRYKLKTYQYVKNCKMPIVIFHGDHDRLINYHSSVRLKELLKPTDTLIILQGQEHNEMTDHPQYIEALNKILRR